MRIWVFYIMEFDEVSFNNLQIAFLRRLLVTLNGLRCIPVAKTRHASSHVYRCGNTYNTLEKSVRSLIFSV